MATKTAVHARWLFSLMLACCLLLSEQGGVRADDGTFTSDMRSLVTLGAATPLQAAIWEADLNECYSSKEAFVSTARDDCEDDVLPPGIYNLAAAIYAARYYLPGPWATYSTYPGQGTVSGLMMIGKDNVGTLTSSGGTATFLFGKCSTSDCGDVQIVYAYRTSAGDRGSGVLQVSNDGCLMYGAFHSTSDPTTIGNFLMARC
jgi:hypothetical protein